MIELGGNIKLKGFSNLDTATLIVVKKIVGNYTKKLSNDHPDFTELVLELNHLEDKKFSINANFSRTSGELTSEANGKNIFFAISAALERINPKPKK